VAPELDESEETEGTEVGRVEDSDGDNDPLACAAFTTWPPTMRKPVPCRQHSFVDSESVLPQQRLPSSQTVITISVELIEKPAVSFEVRFN
jgi:hypothetical protein